MNRLTKMLHRRAGVKDARGVTLAELVVSIGLLGLVGGLIFGLYSSSQKTQTMVNNSANSTVSAQTVTEALNRAIRGAQAVEVKNDRIDIYTTSNTCESWAIDSGGVKKEVSDTAISSAPVKWFSYADNAKPAQEGIPYFRSIENGGIAYSISVGEGAGKINLIGESYPRALSESSTNPCFTGDNPTQIAPVDDPNAVAPYSGPVTALRYLCDTAGYTTKLPVQNFTGTIRWSDGPVQQVSNVNNPTRTLPANRAITARLEGTFTNMSSNAATAPYGNDCLRSVDRWDAAAGTTSAANAFYNAINLTSVVKPPSTINTMAGAFMGAKKFNGDINNWDMSNVTSTINMFNGATSFNQNLNSWSMGKVTNMTGMFKGATSFNGHIDAWDVKNVVTIQEMFANATNFNRPLNNWNTASLVGLRQTFASATSFNQPLNNWNMSKGSDFLYTFSGASAFDQPIGNWDMSKAGNTSGMFHLATSFNQPLNSWNTSNINNMSAMFAYAAKFNQPLNNWNTAKVTNMESMFHRAVDFDQPIGNWNTSKVTNMVQMFAGWNVGSLVQTKFNQDISGWDTSNVTNMRAMFSVNPVFNQSLNNWNTSKVTDVSGMFFSATSFNQSLNNWNTANITDMNNLFSNATSFNQPLNNWNTAKVANMNLTFYNAKAFNQPLNNWNTSNVTNLRAAFKGAEIFKQNISNWNTDKLATAADWYEFRLGTLLTNDDIPARLR